MERRKSWLRTAMVAIALATSFGAAQAGDDSKKPDGPGEPGKEAGKEGDKEVKPDSEKAADSKKSESSAAAPAFTLKDTNDKSHSLADYKDKIVVLEWINHDCPFVKRHYDAGNMQDLQKKYTEKGVIWLSICSSAEGTQGHMAPKAWNEKTAALKAAPTAVLIDADGTVGKAYKARTTPHMFVIDKAGNIAYRGALDDNAAAKPEETKKAKNFVALALDAVLAGKEPEVKEHKPYGCSVKYAKP
jgi:peroxiredoxin